MLNVLSIVSYNFLPSKMGGQKGIGLFNAYLAPLVRLTCITTRDNDPAYAKGYDVLPVIHKRKFRYINPCYFFRARKIIRERKISHLILEQPYYGWLGIMLKWSTGVKLIVHSHNIESLRFRSMNKWWWGILWHYERFTHRKAHFNFFIQDEDRDYAIGKFGLDPAKCATITYGFEMEKAPPAEERQANKAKICGTYGIATDASLLLFNGTLDYKPNLDALRIILDKINPILLSTPHYPYKIIICGNRLPENYQALAAYKDKNIIFAGFVDDISVYFKGADVFINPITFGGGIKTKVVEALGYDMSVVSTHNGAIGIPLSITGDKLAVTADDDWESFSREILKMKTGSSIPKDFFDHFYWGNIAERAAQYISKIP